MSEQDASRELADRRWFELDEARCSEFERLIDAPAVERPELAALLAAPSPFDQQ